MNVQTNNGFNYENPMIDNITYLMLLGINSILLFFSTLLGSIVTLENINLIAGSMTIFFLVLRNARFCIALVFDIFLFFKMSKLEKKEKLKKWLETEPKDK